MPRTPQEITSDIRSAVDTVVESLYETTRLQVPGIPPLPQGQRRKLEARLPDGRTVEIGALADELDAALVHQATAGGEQAE